jgi:ubiquitin-protein ligase
MTTPLDLAVDPGATLQEVIRLVQSQTRCTGNIDLYGEGGVRYSGGAESCLYAVIYSEALQGLGDEFVDRFVPLNDARLRSYLTPPNGATAFGLEQLSIFLEYVRAGGPGSREFIAAIGALTLFPPLVMGLSEILELRKATARSLVAITSSLPAVFCKLVELDLPHTAFEHTLRLCAFVMSLMAPEVRIQGGYWQPPASPLALEPVENRAVFDFALVRARQLNQRDPASGGQDYPFVIYTEPSVGLVVSDGCAARCITPYGESEYSYGKVPLYRLQPVVTLLSIRQIIVFLVECGPGQHSYVGNQVRGILAACVERLKVLRPTAAGLTYFDSVVRECFSPTTDLTAFQGADAAPQGGSIQLWQAMLHAAASLQREKAIFTSATLRIVVIASTPDQGYSSQEAEVRRSLRSVGIVADCLSFSEDNRLFSVFTESGGICFNVGGDVLAVDLAMQDAFLDVSLRDPSTVGRFCWHTVLPNMDLVSAMEQGAGDLLRVGEAANNPHRQCRLLSEAFAELRRADAKEIQSARTSRWLVWFVMFRTDNLVHEVVFIFPPDWPLLPPAIYFLIPFVHINVGVDGRMRMKELQEEYDPRQTTVLQLVLALQDIVLRSQSAKPVGPGRAHLARTDSGDFDKRFRESFRAPNPPGNRYRSVLYPKHSY